MAVGDFLGRRQWEHGGCWTFPRRSSDACDMPTVNSAHATELLSDGLSDLGLLLRKLRSIIGNQSVGWLTECSKSNSSWT